MKKVLLVAVAFMLLTTIAEAAGDQTSFILKMEDAIYLGSRSGKLTKREVRVLNNELNSYEKALWKYEKNGKLSRKEKKKLRRIADGLNKKLDVALYNQERVNWAKNKRKDKAKKSKNRKRNSSPICRIPSNKNRNSRR